MTAPSVYEVPRAAFAADRHLRARLGDYRRENFSRNGLGARRAAWNLARARYWRQEFARRMAQAREEAAARRLGLAWILGHVYYQDRLRDSRATHAACIADLRRDRTGELFVRRVLP